MTEKGSTTTNRFGAQQAMVYFTQLYLCTNGEQVVLGFEIVIYCSATLKILDGGFGKSVIRFTQISQFSTIMKLVKHLRRDGNFENTGPRGQRVSS